MKREGVVKELLSELKRLKSNKPANLSCHLGC